MDMIKLTTPEGKIYVSKNQVVAIAQASHRGLNNTIIKTRLWLSGQEENFINILEEVDEVFNLLS